MELKTILLPVSGDQSDQTGLAVAEILAKRFSAHIEVVHAERSPLDDLPTRGSVFDAPALARILDRARSDIAAHTRSAVERFNEWSSRCGIAVDRAAVDGRAATASWSQVKGRLPDVIRSLGLLVDLILLPSPGPDREPNERREAVEAALIETGRPILLLPRSVPRSLGKVIAVGWNGSLEVSRAVAAAMPLLTTADQVLLLGTRQAEAGADIEALARSLAWRGVQARLRHFDAGHDTGMSLLRIAEEAGADLLVAGAYGHSRLHELLLGSVTDTLLDRTAIPVLLTH